MLKNKFAEIRCGWPIAIFFALYFLYQILSSVVLSVMMLVIVGPENVFSASPDTLADLSAAFAPHPLTLLISNVLIALMIVLLFKLLYKRPLSQMGLKRRGTAREFFCGCILGILAIGLVFVVLLLLGQIRIVSFTPRYIVSVHFLLSLAAFLAVGFCEEMMSRGFLMTVLKTTRNKYIIVLLPQVLFALLHALNPNVTALSLANIFLIGIVFSLQFIKTGKLWLPIGLHFTWNFFQGNVLGLQVSGIETPSVIQIQDTGSRFLNGGAFGAEGGIIVTAVSLLLAAHAVFLLKGSRENWTFESDLPLTRG